jgi:hypothetical protein
MINKIVVPIEADDNNNNNNNKFRNEILDILHFSTFKEIIKNPINMKEYIVTTIKIMMKH